MWLPRVFPSNVRCVFSAAACSSNVSCARNFGFPILRFDDSMYRLLLKRNSLICLKDKQMTAKNEKRILKLLLRCQPFPGKGGSFREGDWAQLASEQLQDLSSGSRGEAESGEREGEVGGNEDQKATRRKNLTVNGSLQVKKSTLEENCKKGVKKSHRCQKKQSACLKIISKSLVAGKECLNILGSETEISDSSSMEGILLFHHLILPLLLKKPNLSKTIPNFKGSNNAWALKVLSKLRPKNVKHSTLVNAIYLLNKTIYGLSIGDLFKLLNVSIVEMNRLKDFLEPVLVLDSKRFKLLSPLLREMTKPDESRVTDLGLGFARILGENQHRRVRLLELAHHYSENGFYFALKQTLSKIDNFLVLFDYSTKFSLFW